jgi:preprotein translocase subunit Sss1
LRGLTQELRNIYRLYTDVTFSGETDPITSASEAAATTEAIVTTARTNPPTEVVEMTVITTSSSTAADIELMLQDQFDALFKEWCRTSGENCAGYVILTTRRRRRQAPVVCTYEYDVDVLESSSLGRPATSQTMKVSVMSYCNNASSFILADLLAKFFNSNTEKFAGIQSIENARVAGAATQTTSAPTNEEANYMIATIVLAVLLGLTLLAFVGFLIYFFVHVAKQKKQVSPSEGGETLKETSSSNANNDGKPDKAAADNSAHDSADL